MVNINQAKQDYEFLQDYRESVIQDIVPSLNSLRDELERRYTGENVYIELELETKKLLNKIKRKQYVKILKRYRDDIYCFECSLYENDIDDAINNDELFYLHDNFFIIDIYIDYLIAVINEYNDLETEFEELIKN